METVQHSSFVVISAWCISASNGCVSQYAKLKAAALEATPKYGISYVAKPTDFCR